MPRLLTITSCALMLQMLGVAAAHAQRWPVGLEATWGFGSGFSDTEYVERFPVQLAFDLSAVAALKSVENGGITAALSTGFQTSGPHSLACRIKPGTTDECVPHFPSFLIVAAAGGWENRARSLRVSGGVALVSDGDFAEEAALQLRMDGAKPVLGHLSLAYSLRALLVPDHRGATVQLIALGVGVRVR